MAKVNIIRQLKIAFIESEYMYSTLMKSQSGYNSMLGLGLVTGPYQKPIIEQIKEAKSKLVFHFEHLLFYSYHYIYDLHSICEVLKSSKSQELNEYNIEIESFLNKTEINLIKFIKNNRIHQKRWDLLTMSYQTDNFKKKYLFCELPIMIMGESKRHYVQGFEFRGVKYIDLISNKELIRINMKTKNTKNTYSIIEFISQMTNYRELFLNFLEQTLNIKDFKIK